jgi:hypothetical protein
VLIVVGYQRPSVGFILVKVDMSEDPREERSWRPEETNAAPESPVEKLMRELQRRRELARTYRAFTRDYLNGPR